MKAISFIHVLPLFIALAAISCGTLPLTDKIAAGTEAGGELDSMEAAVLTAWLGNGQFARSGELDALLAVDFADPETGAKAFALKSLERRLANDPKGAAAYAEKAKATAPRSPSAEALAALDSATPAAAAAALKKHAFGDRVDLFASCVAAKVAMSTASWSLAKEILDEAREHAETGLKTAIDAKRAALTDLLAAEGETPVLGSQAEASAATALEFASLETVTVEAAVKWIAERSPLVKAYGMTRPASPEALGAAILPPQETGGLAHTGNLSRGMTAVILWNAFAKAKNDPALLTKYSMRYRERAAKAGFASPIPDVAYGSTWFDAAFGVVEKGIMDLPDGRNFKPGEIVSRGAFLEALGKAAALLGW